MNSQEFDIIHNTTAEEKTIKKFKGLYDATLFESVEQLQEYIETSSNIDYMTPVKCVCNKSTEISPKRLDEITPKSVCENSSQTTNIIELSIPLIDSDSMEYIRDDYSKPLEKCIQYKKEIMCCFLLGIHIYALCQMKEPQNNTYDIEQLMSKCNCNAIKKLLNY
jgi:hypothetical protein